MHRKATSAQVEVISTYLLRTLLLKYIIQVHLPRVQSLLWITINRLQTVVSWRKHCWGQKTGKNNRVSAPERPRGRTVTDVVTTSVVHVYGKRKRSIYNLDRPTRCWYCFQKWFCYKQSQISCLFCAKPQKKFLSRVYTKNRCLSAQE